MESTKAQITYHEYVYLVPMRYWHVTDGILTIILPSGAIEMGRVDGDFDVAKPITIKVSIPCQA